MLIPVGSKSLIQSGVNCYGTIIKWKFEKECYTSLIDSTKKKIMNEQDEALKPVKGCTTPNAVGGDTEK